jgi:hypothetical protein
MERIPAGPIPIVPPDRAVTNVSGVGPGGRDITVGLYAADYGNLAGAHVRCRWPEQWTVSGVGDSLRDGQIFGYPDRLHDRSYVTAFRCISGGSPVAVGRFDIHATRNGSVELDPAGVLQVVDCHARMTDLLPSAGREGSGKISGAVTELSLSVRSPRVGSGAAEFALSLPEEAVLSATIYDVSGRVVKKILDGERKPGGIHSLRWDGTTNRGSRAASGVYIFELQVGDKRFTEDIVMLR